MYGYQTFDCFAECCPPSPLSDCIGSINDTFPEDWVYLVYLCEGKRSCEYQYKGRNLDSCDPEKVANYMQVFYGCYPIAGKL